MKYKLKKILSSYSAMHTVQSTKISDATYIAKQRVWKRS